MNVVQSINTPIERVKLVAFDEETYRRLREIKATVDPDGLFVAAHPVA